MPIACPTPAYAAPAAAPTPAKAAYDAGVEHFKAGRFQDAIVEVNKAYRLDPNAVLVFNMARAFEELKQYASAVEYYRKYLEMAPSAPDRKNVEETLRTLEILQKQTAAPAEVPFTVTSNPDGGSVFVDGKPVGKTPYKATVPVGHHFLAVELDGYERAAREFDAAADKPATSEVVLVKKPETAPVAANEGGVSRRTWAYIALGVGGALMAGGGFAGWRASLKADKLDQIDTDPTLADKSTYDSLKSDGKLMAGVADGLFITGALGIGTGIVLLLTGGEPASPTAHLGGAPVFGWTF